MRYYSFMRSASPLAPAELRGNRLWMRNYAISLRSWHNRKKFMREGECAMKQEKAYYHLPGSFEFYELYREFLPLFRTHREYFYDWCEISSIYGSPADCLWGGGRAGFGSDNPEEVLKLTQEYGISARLTFSNSLLRKEHLTDKKCNILCKMFEEVGEKRNGVIVHSDLLLKYLEINYPKLYFVSSTTKVLTDFNEFLQEVKKEDFRYVVPDFRLNKAFDKLCRAYIEARYNRLFTVNKEEYEYMLARTEVLREVTIRECAARMTYYDEMIEKEEKDKI